jgi:hypothetical protein
MKDGEGNPETSSDTVAFTMGFIAGLSYMHNTDTERL